MTRNLRVLSILLLVWTLSHQASAQNRAIGTLPLINNGDTIRGTEENLNHTREYDRILKIYNDLVNARGDFRFTVPELFLLDQEGHAAFIDLKTNHIILEKKAYDVCDRFGDEALAFLLGHELTHYYEKHGWRSAYAKENSDLEIGKTLDIIMDGVANEAEADYLGGFLAYTAGYGLFEKSDTIIETLYREYKLQENMPGYPVLKDRMALSRRSVKKLNLLIDAFELGNYLAASGNFDLAYQVYDYVLNFYQSRELYNNLGTFAAINAMELFHPDSLKFKYVTELDLQFQSSRNTAVPVQTMINQFLDQAIMHFNSAINLDPSYAPAYLNKANAYALKKDWVRARFYLIEEALPKAKAQPKKYKKTLEDMLILQGIIEASTGNVSAARELFSSLAKTNQLASLNLDALDGKKVNKKILRQAKNSEDNIGNMSLDSLFSTRRFDNSRVIEVTSDLIFFQNSDPVNGYRYFFMDDVTNKNRKKRYAFIQTTDGYKGTTSKGIKVGDPRQKVVSEYNDPVTTIETTEGQLLAYDDIIFILNNNQVKKWIITGSQRFR